MSKIFFAAIKAGTAKPQRRNVQISRDIGIRVLHMNERQTIYGRQLLFACLA